MTPINFKLINLLNTFSQKEINEFRKFIASPLYTNGRNYLPLLNHLIKYHSKGFDLVYSRDIYAKLYPDKKFSAQTLKNRFSELYKLGEGFLIYRSLKEDRKQKDKILLKMLLERKLLNRFDSKFKKAITVIQNEKYDDKKYLDLIELYDLNEIFLKEKGKIEDIYKQYYESSHTGLCCYLINIFHYGLEFSVQEYDNRVYETNFVTDFLKSLRIEPLIKEMNNSGNTIYRVTAMIYYLYKSSESQDNYFIAHKIFTEISGELKENFKIEIFNQMIYYCIQMQNEGIKKFQFELFKLYNEKLDQGLFSDLNKKVYYFNSFRDYVFIGIAIKEYKWVEDFIKKYSKELPSEFREDEKNMSNAKLYFALGKYDKSMMSLGNIKTANYLLYLDASTLRLCCYYEKNNLEEAFLELDKLKHYIRNHKEIPKIHFIFADNFIKIYQKILKMQSSPGKTDAGFLIKEIGLINIISKKDWLTEKISELIN